MYGPLFEHLLGLKPWDLERMTRAQVTWRLDWLKRQRESGEAALNG
jgi:hypothetical protein